MAGYSVGAAAHDITLSASDPLNLAGVISPGPPVPSVLSFASSWGGVSLNHRKRKSPGPTGLTDPAGPWMGVGLSRDCAQLGQACLLVCGSPLAEAFLCGGLECRLRIRRYA